MSLETEIAALTSKATSLLDYFGNAKASIANALAAAVAAAPEISAPFTSIKLPAMTWPPVRS